MPYSPKSPVLRPLGAAGFLWRALSERLGGAPCGLAVLSPVPAPPVPSLTQDVMSALIEELGDHSVRACLIGSHR